MSKNTSKYLVDEYFGYIKVYNDLPTAFGSETRRNGLLGFGVFWGL